MQKHASEQEAISAQIDLANLGNHSSLRSLNASLPSKNSLKTMSEVSRAEKINNKEHF